MGRHREAEREKAITRERLEKYDTTGEYIAHEDVDAWLRSIGTKRELAPPARIRKAAR